MTFRILLVVGLGAGAALLGGCSSATPSAATNADAGSGSTSSCSTMDGSQFDDSASCFEQPSTLTGLCRTDPNPPTTTGLENVCVVNAAGALYLVTVGTQTSLHGPGWTIGQRAAPDVVAATDTPLSAADVARCAKAQGVPAAHACSADAGSD